MLRVLAILVVVGCGSAKQTTPDATVAEIDIEVSTSSHDFGDTTVETEGAQLTITVSNVGMLATDIEVATAGDVGQFQLDNSCDETLSPNSSCLISATFSPTGDVGLRTTLIDISAGDITKSVTLRGEAVAAGAFSLQGPSGRDLMLVGVATSATEIFTFTNTTANNVVPSVEFTSSSSEMVVSSDSCDGSSIVGGESCVIEVTFTPSEPGLESANLSVVGGGGTSTAALIGTGKTTVTYVVSGGGGEIAETILGTCQNNCTQDYTSVDSVEVTGTILDDTKYANGWSGCTLQGTTCNRLLDQENITVEFGVATKGRLTTSLTGNGGNRASIQSGAAPGCGPGCTYRSPGEQVSVTVSPSSYFNAWTSGCTSATNQCTATMPLSGANKSVVADAHDAVTWNLEATNSNQTNGLILNSIMGIPCGGASGTTTSCVLTSAETVDVVLTSSGGPNLNVFWQVIPASAATSGCTTGPNCTVTAAANIEVKAFFSEQPVPPNEF